MGIHLRGRTNTRHHQNRSTRPRGRVKTKAGPSAAFAGAALVLRRAPETNTLTGVSTAYAGNSGKPHGLTSCRLPATQRRHKSWGGKGERDWGNQAVPATAVAEPWRPTKQRARTSSRRPAPLSATSQLTYLLIKGRIFSWQWNCLSDFSPECSGWWNCSGRKFMEVPIFLRRF